MQLGKSASFNKTLYSGKGIQIEGPMFESLSSYSLSHDLYISYHQFNLMFTKFKA